MPQTPARSTTGTRPIRIIRRLLLSNVTPTKRISGNKGLRMGSHLKIADTALFVERRPMVSKVQKNVLSSSTFRRTARKSGDVWCLIRNRSAAFANINLCQVPSRQRLATESAIATSLRLSRVISPFALSSFHVERYISAARRDREKTGGGQNFRGTKQQHEQ